MEDVMPVGLIVKGDNPIASLERVRSLGIPTCQMYIPPEKWHSETNITKIKEAVSRTGIRITCIFCSFEGESYADIPTIKRTIGFLSSDTREKRTKKTLAF